MTVFDRKSWCVAFVLIQCDKCFWPSLLVFPYKAYLLIRQINVSAFFCDKDKKEIQYQIKLSLEYLLET